MADEEEEESTASEIEKELLSEEKSLPQIEFQEPLLVDEETIESDIIVFGDEEIKSEDEEIQKEETSTFEDIEKDKKEQDELAETEQVEVSESISELQHDRLLSFTDKEELDEDALEELWIQGLNLESDEIIINEDTELDEINEPIPEYLLNLPKEIEYTREEINDMYQAVMNEIQSCASLNRQLQVKLAEYMRMKKQTQMGDKEGPPVVEQMDPEIEAKYQQNLDIWTEYKEAFAEEEKRVKKEILELRTTCNEALAKASLEMDKFLADKKEKLKIAVHSQTGIKLPIEVIDQYLNKEKTKYYTLKLYRARNTAIKYRTAKLEAILKNKEESTSSIRMVDFEQLKIENQAFIEKIEERNEELTKLRKKITSTINIMGHIKEKIHFLNEEFEELNIDLTELESIVSQKREVLAKIKHMKDKLRDELNQLQQKCGLLGKTHLLHDFKTKQDQALSLKNTLEDLKIQHYEIMVAMEKYQTLMHSAKRGVTNAKVASVANRAHVMT